MSPDPCQTRYLHFHDNNYPHVFDHTRYFQCIQFPYGGLILERAWPCRALFSVCWTDVCSGFTYGTDQGEEIVFSLVSFTKWIDTSRVCNRVLYYLVSCNESLFQQTTTDVLSRNLSDMRSTILGFCIVVGNVVESCQFCLKLTKSNFGIDFLMLIHILWRL